VSLFLQHINGLQACEEETLRVHHRELNELFILHATDLTYFAYKIIQHQSEAEDLVVNMFMKNAVKVCQLNNPKQKKAFLYKCTENACLDFLRRQKTTIKYTTEAERFYTQAAFDSDSLEWLKKETELLSKVYKAIDKLPKKSKRVFQLSYLKGLSTDSIAKKQKISRSSVTSHLQYARNKIKDYCKSLGVDV
jgi:RNA polymerase sigma factor (sigma-70 family)